MSSISLSFILLAPAGSFSQEPLSGEWRAPVTVVVEDDFAPRAGRTRYFMDVDGLQIELHFTGRPPSLTSGQIVSVRGSLLGRHLTATLSDATPAPRAVPSCSTVGEQKIAILMLQFPGVPFPSDIIAPADLHDMYFSTTRVSVDGYLRDASYGQTFATGDVFGPFPLDQYYDFQSQQAQGMDAAIRAADWTVDFSLYNHVVVVWPAPGVSGWGGRATVSCTTLNSPSKGPIAGTYAVLGVGTQQPYNGLVGLSAHEEGHNLGLNHASSLDFAPQVLGPPGVDGVHLEYGDVFSMMGGGEGQLLLGHFAAPHKNKLGWLDPSGVQSVETDGSFVLQPFENSAGPRALRVRRAPGVNEWLWLEYRQPIGYDATLAAAGAQQFSGALIHYEDPAQEPSHTLMLDFTPSTPHNFSDPALAAGQTWSDSYSPLSIRVNSATSSGLSVGVLYRTPCTTLSPASRNHGSGAETGSVAISAAAGCAWAAASTVDWITVTSGSSGNGSGTVSYALKSNDTRGARTGFIFVGFQAFTIAQATSFIDQPPSFDALAPNSGTGLSQAFTFFLSDPNGAANLSHIDVDFVKTGFICQVGYSMATRELYMLTDDLTSVIGPVIAGVNLALQNSQCALDVSGFTVTSSGNSMQLTFPMVFMSPGLWSVQVNVYNAAKSHIMAFAGSWVTPRTSCSFRLAPASLSVGKNETAGTIALGAVPVARGWRAARRPGLGSRPRCAAQGEGPSVILSLRIRSPLPVMAPSPSEDKSFSCRNLRTPARSP